MKLCRKRVEECEREREILVAERLQPEQRFAISLHLSLSLSIESYNFEISIPHTPNEKKKLQNPYNNSTTENE